MRNSVRGILAWLSKERISRLEFCGTSPRLEVINSAAISHGSMLPVSVKLSLTVSNSFHATSTSKAETLFLRQNVVKVFLSDSAEIIPVGTEISLLLSKFNS
ncbi:hypothetical protein MXB_3403 [Myxobolus squamalis]|nr:hypothetical protein MXB_3403 [Myxobolus squamalis]